VTCRRPILKATKGKAFQGQHTSYPRSKHPWCLLLAVAGLFSQAPVNGVGQEVRRALPAGPVGGPAPRALPVNPSTTDSGVAPESILNERIRPQRALPERVPETPTEPKEAQSAGSAAEPDTRTRDQVGSDEIRLAPSGSSGWEKEVDPAKAQLAVADGLYARKLYDLAAPEYEKYLGEFRDSTGRAEAMYRLADSYARIGQEGPAVNTYRMLINEVGNGEFVGSAAFRLAAREFDRKAYWDAIPLYEKAFTNAKSAEVKLTARYYQGKCLELLNKKGDAKTAYRDVVATKDKNPYRDAANLSLAYFALENSQKQEAYDRFSQLANEAAKPAVRSEATVRAGILAADLKQRDQADQLFRSAASGGDQKWKQIAQLELMKLQYDGDKFAQVLDSYGRTVDALGEETKPSVLLLVANSYRQLGKHQKALDFYAQLIRQFPTSPEAADARYQRLVSYDATKDPNLIMAVDTFLETNPNREKADKAKLMKAQALVQQGKYDLSAKLYTELTTSSLPDLYRAECYYAAGYSLSQINATQPAITAFTGLLTKFPTYKLAATALLKRGLLYQQLKNYPAAISDFDKIIHDYPAAPERETALLQKALTLGQQGKHPEMAASFQLFLNDYPNSPSAAQANFWVGWAAFEAKQYENALAPLEAARKLDPAEYNEKVSLRLIYCYQLLQRKDEAAHEIDDFVKEDTKRAALLESTCRWLGTNYFGEKNYPAAANYLGLIANSLPQEQVDRDVWLLLGKSQIELGKFQEATDSLNNYLARATDPGMRAQALIPLSEAQAGAHQFEEATKSAQEALGLQPEGRLNADARMAIGDVEAARGNFKDAARSYLSIAVLYEDPEVTPNALEKAYKAFRHSGDAVQASKTLSELKSRFPNYQIHEPATG
jgi:TolA-binding protein